MDSTIIDHNRRSLPAVVCSCLVFILLVSVHPLVVTSGATTNTSPNTGSSWNPKVNCTPITVSVEQILGNQTSPLGGASRNGSIFNPGITSPYGPDNAKRWLTPSSTTPTGWVSPGPTCAITNAQGQNVSVFVQINGVQRGFRAEEDWNSTFQPINGGTAYSTGRQSDTTFDIVTPGYGPCSSTNTTGCMHAVHAEIDHDWKGAGYCGPNTGCDNNTLVQETGAYKTLIDVQGFVFWDSEHLNESAHNFSGWELHSLTAWRISNTPSDWALSANPNSLALVGGQSATSIVTVNTYNLFSGNVSFRTSISPSTGATGPAPTATMTPSSILIPSGGIGSSRLNFTTAPSNYGNYTITVIGQSANQTRTVSLTAIVKGFTISAMPATANIVRGANGTYTVIITSVSSFNSTVSMSASVAPANQYGPVVSVSPPSVTLSPGKPSVSTLTLSAGPATALGAYAITIVGKAGSTIQQTTVLANVVDFSVAASPSSMSIPAGGSATATIALTSMNSFAGNVTLSTSVTPASITGSIAPVMPTASTSSSVVILTANNTSFATMTVSTSLLTTPGTYTIIVTATSGGASHTTAITVTVTVAGL